MRRRFIDVLRVGAGPRFLKFVTAHAILSEVSVIRVPDFSAGLHEAFLEKGEVRRNVVGVHYSKVVRCLREESVEVSRKGLVAQTRLPEGQDAEV